MWAWFFWYRGFSSIPFCLSTLSIWVPSDSAWLKLAAGPQGWRRTSAFSSGTWLDDQSLLLCCCSILFVVDARPLLINCQIPRTDRQTDSHANRVVSSGTATSRFRLQSITNRYVFEYLLEIKYTVSQKRETILLSISLLNVGRFS